MTSPGTVTILSPASGEIIPLDKIPDPVFSSGKLGKGFGLIPSQDKVLSPVSGRVSMAAQTKHALGIVSDSGLEILLHLGVDTVELEGKPFVMDLAPGDRVEAGQELASMNRALVEQAGKDTTIIVAITNSPKALATLEVNHGPSQAGQAAASAQLLSAAQENPQEKAAARQSAKGQPDSPRGLSGYDRLAWNLVQHIGGADNVKSVIHCITRVRFYLKDDSKAADQTIKNLDGVIDVARAGGQFQVVIGPAVEDVYAAVLRQLGPAFAGGDSGQTTTSSAEKPQDILGWLKYGFSSLIGVITGSMMPVIGLLAASGVLKGLLTILTYYGLIDQNSQTFIIISAMGDAVFYFLPIFVGFTAAKRLGADPVIVSIIGGVLAYPSIVELAQAPATGSFAGVETNANFFGLPFPAVSYTYSIFPMIVAAWLCATIEPVLKKWIPAVLRMIFVPLLEVFVVATLILVVLGPIIMWVSSGLANGIQWVYDLSPAISGLVIGAFYQCLVIFGLHWAVIPLIASDIASSGSSSLNAIISATMVAQGAGALAVFAKTRNTQMRGLSGSAAIAGFCGITEPAMYGINLKYGRVFLLSSVGAALGGLLTGLLQVNMWGFTGSLIGFFSFVNPDVGFDNSWYGFWIASGATILVSFTLVYLFGFKDADLEQERTVEKRRLGRREPLSS